MKKLLIGLLLIITVAFPFSFKQILCGIGGTGDTVLAAAACTVNLGRSLDGVSRINAAYWVDTIGASPVTISGLCQVSPDNSIWLNLHAKVLGDSYVAETPLTLVLDTVMFNNATTGQSSIGCFKYVRFIWTGVNAANKAIIYYYLNCWY